MSGGVKKIVCACFAGGMKGNCNGMMTEGGGYVDAKADVRTL